MAFRHLLFLLGGPASSPSPRFLSPFLRNLPLEVCKGLREWHGAYLHPVRVVQPFHPMGVWLFHCNLTHLSAFSLPPIPLCAGHHLIPMMMSGLACRSKAICLLALRAYYWSGPGSSEVIFLMVAWVLVKIVTRSNIVCLLEADYSALARAVRSSS